MKIFSRQFRMMWAVVGLTAVVVLVMWPVIAYQPEPAARAALVSDALVRVVKTDSAIGFFPTDTARAGGVGFLFFPETLVDPISYAPLARATAEAGFPTWIMPLSHRGVGGTDDPVLYTRAEALLRATGPAGGWVVGGHSHGAGVATRMAATGHGRIAGLVVIGGSDPKDIDLSPLLIPSAKIVGTRDGVASPDAVRESAMLSPVETVWTWVEGGNHSAFGWYGFQPGDHRATISAEEQRAVMIRAVVEALRRAEGWHG